MKKNNFAYYIIQFYLIVSFILTILYSYRIIYIRTNSYFLFITGIFSFILYLIYKYKNKNIYFFELLIVLMSIFSLLSYHFAQDKIIALNGYSGGEGILSIISYNILILLGTTISNIKHIISILKTIIIITILHVLMAIPQFFSIDKILFIQVPKVFGYPAGFMYSASFYSTLLTLSTTIMIIKILFYSKYNYKDILLALFLLFGLFIGNVMSSVLTLFVTLIITILLLLKLDKKRTNIKKHVLLSIGVIIILVIVNFFNNNLLKNDIKQMLNESNKLIQGKQNETFGNGRIHIWKESTKAFLKKSEYHNYGIGIDNFLFINGKKYIKDINNNRIVYKAHNEYLQILICEGYYRLAIYLILIFYVLFNSIKKELKKKNLTRINWILIFCVLNYLIQAFFNISSILISPYYYILLGILINKGLISNE